MLDTFFLCWPGFIIIIRTLAYTATNELIPDHHILYIFMICSIPHLFLLISVIEFLCLIFLLINYFYLLFRYYTNIPYFHFHDCFSLFSALYLHPLSIFFFFRPLSYNFTFSLLIHYFLSPLFYFSNQQSNPSLPRVSISFSVIFIADLF